MCPFPSEDSTEKKATDEHMPLAVATEKQFYRVKERAERRVCDAVEVRQVQAFKPGGVGTWPTEGGQELREHAVAE